MPRPLAECPGLGCQVLVEGGAMCDRCDQKARRDAAYDDNRPYNAEIADGDMAAGASPDAVLAEMAGGRC